MLTPVCAVVLRTRQKESRFEGLASATQTVPGTCHCPPICGEGSRRSLAPTRCCIQVLCDCGKHSPSGIKYCKRFHSGFHFLAQSLQHRIRSKTQLRKPSIRGAIRCEYFLDLPKCEATLAASGKCRTSWCPKFDPPHSTDDSLPLPRPIFVRLTCSRRSSDRWKIWLSSRQALAAKA